MIILLCWFYYIMHIKTIKSHILNEYTALSDFMNIVT